jgi:hypothetical protein
MLRVLAGLGIAAVVIAVLYYASLAGSQVTCEACLEFGGRSECRTASGSDREEAVSGAISGVCAVLAGGVTEGLQCQRTPPRSVRCSE